jgi:hypothetical protein
MDLAQKYADAKRKVVAAAANVGVGTPFTAAAEAELDAVVREMLRPLCEQVELREGVPVQWVGCYVLNWGKLDQPEWGWNDVDPDAILGLTGADGGEDDDG